MSVERWSHDFRLKKTAGISLGAGDWIFGRPSDCLDEGSVRTLKNYFKTTGRNLNDVLKYTLVDFRRSSDESWAKCPPSRYNYIILHYITLYMARKVVVWKLYIEIGRGCVKLLVEISNYLLKIIFWLMRHIDVIASHVLFSPLKRTKSPSSAPRVERIISYRSRGRQTKRLHVWCKTWYWRLNNIFWIYMNSNL